MSRKIRLSPACLPVILVLISMVSSAVNAQISQERAMLQVMRTKTLAYFASDTARWQSCWLQDSIASRTIAYRTGVESEVGWAKINAKIRHDINLGRPVVTVVNFENVHLRLDKKLAFVEAEEVLKSSETDTNVVNRTATYTVLVSQHNTWKIASQIRLSTASYSNVSANREDDLNTIGYGLLEEKRISEAIDVFKLNVKLNPESWNPYDSLAEGYERMGDMKLAIENYEKSLVLNPRNEIGMKALARLKKQ